MVVAPLSSAPRKMYGEAQDVVDLVGVVRAARGDDGVVAHGLHVFGLDFGVRVGQGEDQGARGHFLDHVLFEHATRRQAEEHVGTVDHLAQGAQVGLCANWRLSSSISSVRPSYTTPARSVTQMFSRGMPSLTSKPRQARAAAPRPK